MECALDRALTVLVMVFVLGCVAAAQVTIGVPSSQFKEEEKIEARIVNNSEQPISYCVEFGQRSPHHGTVEATPIPFHVERRDHGGWNVLLIGPDVGSSRHPVTLDPGASHTFPFRLIDSGEVRLVLYYWVSARRDVCDPSARGRKKERSRVFAVVKQ
jgi:hypothetical protein